MRPLKVEFFHDAVCAWCFVLAPRLQQLQAELNLDIQHRTFILQTSREAMIERFGSMSQAKQTILEHWRACAEAEDTPRINIEGMRQQAFDYPSGLLAGLACQAATLLADNSGHGRMFERLQEAHLMENRNIGDHATVLTLAEEAGLDTAAFALAFYEQAPQLLHDELAMGQRLGIRSVPSLVIDGRFLVSGALGLDELRHAIVRVREAQ
jgi:putative protein-disulfide isomerase